MEDSSIMPFGKYKGIKLANVPPEYLIWLYENANVYGELKKYIEDNMDVLKFETDKKQKK